MQAYQRLGEWLRDQGIISELQLDELLTERARSNERLGEIAVRLKIATEEQVVSALSHQYSIDVAELETLTLDPIAISVVPSGLAMKRLILPVSLSKFEFSCVISDPLDFQLTDALQQELGRPLKLLLAPVSKLRQRIAEAYGMIPTAQPSQPVKKARIKKDAQEDRNALLSVYMAAQGVSA